MRLRLSVIGALILIEVLSLLGVAVSATDAPEYEAYVVQAHQTITSIAAEYGIPAADVARYNELRVSDTLQVGQILLVPISVQLTPQTGTGYLSAPSIDGNDLVVAEAPVADSPNAIRGYLGRVSAKNIEIRSKPNGGTILYDRAARGTELLVIGQTDTHYAVLMSNGATGWVPCVALTLTEQQMVVDRPGGVSADVGRQEIVDTAFEYIGIPYVYGGRLPNSVDCSLLVQTVFARHGVKLPRTAAQQFLVGDEIDVADLVPGDRLYFVDAKNSSRIGHTGIYIGGGKFIHASSNRGAVGVDELKSQPYANRYAGARR